jgi:hypothetical protein
MIGSAFSFLTCSARDLQIHVIALLLLLWPDLRRFIVAHIINHLIRSSYCGRAESLLSG